MDLVSIQSSGKSENSLMAASIITRLLLDRSGLGALLRHVADVLQMRWYDRKLGALVLVK